ncbi:hypothetical protein CLOSTMETH_02932 [[Clostridium] methylpentosum DSM 5476]|uniref:Uncharacterized protein n=1 Tax=[Clostridium] methylpentosum DSM 5476 TaxID=537013 RepID=C0EGD9_9FIRM|nr:hypothetical protein CLOSTMETH_02932 [[Clostridium] methylpentosum DSM 5476]
MGLKQDKHLYKGKLSESKMEVRTFEPVAPGMAGLTDTAISIHTRKGTATPASPGIAARFVSQYTPARGRQLFAAFRYCFKGYLNTHPQGGAEDHTDLA